jgi:hypothetical protein
MSYFLGNKTEEFYKLCWQWIYMYYKPIAEELCKGLASESEVEHVLDRMLQFCGSDEMLNLFKRICRCYYERYPEMIAFEINGYREMWDE